MNLLDGKICIITGGGRGIGYATAVKFAEDGYLMTFGISGIRIATIRY